ncbi:MAG: UrcA family protein [Hyphomonadaceae bacterium]
MTILLKTIAAVTAASAALLLPMLMLEPANALPASTASEPIMYRDLDLTSPAAGQALLKRLSLAASDVCNQTNPRLHGQAFTDCRTAAISEAVREVHASKLTTAWRSDPASRLPR